MTPTGRERGFTLIEILVAVTLIAIVLTVALLSINLVRDDRDLRNESERLVALLEAARDDAMFQGREFGLEAVRGGYRFVEYDPASEQWAEVPGDDFLTSWTLPEGLELTLEIEDKQIVLASEPAEIEYDPRPGAAPSRYAPHLLIFSSGEMTPFRMRITRQSDRLFAVVEGDLLGRIEIVEAGDENAV